jgi:hypothetical protein
MTRLAAWYRRHPFLIGLAGASLLIGLPLAIAAAWFGVSLALAAGDGRLRDAYCHLAPQDDTLRQQEFALRRRLAELESQHAHRLALCQPCAEQDLVDVAVVMDTSISMNWPATMDAAAEQQRMALIEREAGAITTQPGQERFQRELAATPPGAERMQRARQAALAAIGELPPHARVRLFSFSTFAGDRAAATQCRITDRGGFDGTGRPALQQALAALRPDASGTPLALAIEQGAAAVRTRPAGTPGMVLVVTDGVDTCRGDPCAAARAARAADPGVTISVVDIAANAGLACLAEATGGRLFSPMAGADLGRAVAEAIRQPRTNCVPRAARAG